jgi:hypothetical protein
MNDGIIAFIAICIAVGLLLTLRPTQSLVVGKNAGNTLLLGMPGGFVPLNQQTKRQGNLATRAGTSVPVGSFNN